jgi:hypothetical protein
MDVYSDVKIPALEEGQDSIAEVTIARSYQATDEEGNPKFYFENGILSFAVGLKKGKLYISRKARIVGHRVLAEDLGKYSPPVNDIVFHGWLVNIALRAITEELKKKSMEMEVIGG